MVREVTTYATDASVETPLSAVDPGANHYVGSWKNALSSIGVGAIDGHTDEATLCQAKDTRANETIGRCDRPIGESCEATASLQWPSRQGQSVTYIGRCSIQFSSLTEAETCERSCQAHLDGAPERFVTHATNVIANLIEAESEVRQASKVLERAQQAL